MIENLLILTLCIVCFIWGFVAGAADAKRRAEAQRALDDALDDDLNELPRIAERIRRDMASKEAPASAPHKQWLDRQLEDPEFKREYDKARAEGFGLPNIPNSVRYGERHPFSCECLVCQQHQVTPL